MYAVLDIETTGGSFNEEGITEIAIYRFDGTEVVDQLITLINPQIPIQPFVIKLTGINNAMLTSAPKFYEVAKRIIEITEGCIIVAHNTSFDYRVIRTEFDRLGYQFDRETLCTVELSKKLLPDQPSYSLGKLVRSLGIPITDRHRASGDAMATVKLFKLLLNKDVNKNIIESTIKREIKAGITPKLLDILDSIPSRTGLFYIHNHNGKIIYIGSSKDMKKKINQLFTSSKKLFQQIQREVFTVTHELTGNELIAELKEQEEIQNNKPKLNRFRRYKSAFTYGLYWKKIKNSYDQLLIAPLDNRKKELIAFQSQEEAKEFLYKITQEHLLCQKINGLFAPEQHCLPYATNRCNGACKNEENIKEYNVRVKKFICEFETRYNNILLIDQGRTIEERSALILQKNQLIGYSYFDLNHQINNIEILKNLIVPLHSTKEKVRLIRYYLLHKKSIKTISI